MTTADRAKGRFWPTNLFRRPVTVTGRDEIARGTIGAIDRTFARGMQGLTGTILAGITADPMYRYSGYVDYATLAMTNPGGASRNLRADPNIALPATAGPLVITSTSPANAVMNALAQMPPGFR